MLGEIHAIINEFPEFKEGITALTQQDEAFAKDNKIYNELDTEIRKLELNGAPIDDETMHQMKRERAQLKDVLYQCLVKAARAEK